MKNPIKHLHQSVCKHPVSRDIIYANLAVIDMVSYCMIADSYMLCLWVIDRVNSNLDGSLVVLINWS